MTPEERKAKFIATFKEQLEATAKEFNVTVDECAEQVLKGLRARLARRIPRDIAPGVLAEMQAACPDDVLNDIVRRGSIQGPSGIATSGQVTAVHSAPGIFGSQNGWRVPMPMGPPPGTNYVDRICDEFDRRDRAELAQKMGLRP
jgi:hypothetical protein